MKTSIWISLVAMLLLAGCQSGEAVTTFTPDQTQVPYPPPHPTAPPNAGGYPAPGALPESGNTGYPAPGQEEAMRVAWEQAKTMLMNGEVAQVTQLHSMEVILILIDGREVRTTEPAIDEVFKAIDECGEKCAGIGVATE